MQPDFQKHCPPCLWCCHGENVFVSAAEADALGEDGFSGKPNSGSCEKLDTGTGRCTIHNKRPIECRLFPLDILELEVQEGYLSPTWVIWTGPCPATTEMSKDEIETLLRRWEGRLTYGWVREYLDHHKLNQPAKYGTSRAIRIRQVRIDG